MKSLLTKITENIGDSIAQASNKNELVSEKLHLNSNIKVADDKQLTIKMKDIQMKDLLDAIEKEDTDLSKLLTEFIANSQTLKKKYAKKSQRTSSSYGGCGSSSRNSGCGSSRSSWSPSWGSGGCGSSRSSRSAC